MTLANCNRAPVLQAGGGAGGGACRTLGVRERGRLLLPEHTQGLAPLASTPDPALLPHLGTDFVSSPLKLEVETETSSLLS